jgi:hypothetical protein
LRRLLFVNKVHFLIRRFARRVAAQELACLAKSLQL